MIALRVLGACLVILMWGDLVHWRLAGRRPELAAKAPRAAMTWLFGCGLVSWLMFVCLWAGLSLNAAVGLLTMAGSLLWIAFRGSGMVMTLAQARFNAPNRARPSLAASFHRSPWSLIFGLLLLLQTGSVAFAAAVSPLTDWDAWVNWAGKANALFIDQTLSPTLYNNPARLPTNMDYPLMLPLIEAWFYAWLGRIHEPVIGLISFLFYVALLLLFYHAARHLVRPLAALGFTALLATIPRLERMGHNGLADVPLASLVLLTFLLLFYEYNKGGFHLSKSAAGQNGRWRIAALALAAGLLPWLKNEGWLWLLLVSVVWLVGLWKRSGRRPRLDREGLAGQPQLQGREGGQPGRWPIFERIPGFWNALGLRSVLLYGLIVLLIAGAWPFFLALNGTYRFTFLPLTAATLAANLPRVPWIARAMLGRLLNPYWNFIWFFMGLAALLRRKRSWAGPVGWLLFPIAAFILLVGITYIFSRFDPYQAHLNNSVERLILQAAPLALWWLIGQSVAVGWVGVRSKE